MKRRKRRRKLKSQPIIIIAVIAVIVAIGLAYYFGRQSAPTQQVLVPPDDFVKIKLYYYNKLQDPNRTFKAKYVLPVVRTVPRTKAPVKDAIKLLIQGDLSWQERSAGFETEFPHPKFKLLSAKLQNGVVTLKFPDIPGFTTGGAARVWLLAESIRKTARQFSQVRQVVFEPEYLFQP